MWLADYLERERDTHTVLAMDTRLSPIVMLPLLFRHFLWKKRNQMRSDEATRDGPPSNRPKAETRPEMARERETARDEFKCLFYSVHCFVIRLLGQSWISAGRPCKSVERWRVSNITPHTRCWFTRVLQLLRTYMEGWKREREREIGDRVWVNSFFEGDPCLGWDAPRGLTRVED